MTSLENATEPEAWFKLDREGKKLAIGGAWTIAESARLDRDLAALELSGPVTIDASKISRLDSAGAWLLLRTRRALEAAGDKVSDASNRLAEWLRKSP
jgi:phospholipid/cholesterol/gamma-HCH transport system permease protein